MEKLLLKLARQLDSLDEASLMSLWSKYATMTTRFEPTKRWEENCLVFSLIQAKHWKNQLFNYCFSQQRHPPLKNASGQQDLPFGDVFEALRPAGEPPVREARKACRVLTFRRPDARHEEAAQEKNEPGSGE